MKGIRAGVGILRKNRETYSSQQNKLYSRSFKGHASGILFRYIFIILFDTLHIKLYLFVSIYTTRISNIND